MKTALVLTTINVPRVLALYRAYGPDVHFFIAGDRKSDDEAITNFLIDIPNHSYYGIDLQHSMYPKLSALLGENCIQRRNIATLEAVKWGADVIVMIDDDNIPMSAGYFSTFESCFGQNAFKRDWLFAGLKATSPSGWFDVGQLLQPAAEHRGFPYTKRAQPSFEGSTNVKVGVAAGICMGDPDIGAVERIANGPIVHGVSEILRSGVVTDPNETWTVFNSQNTAFIRELAPAMFMLPGCGRYDDIFASLICQRVMREKGLHVHFGRPFVWQQRNKHDLTKDLVMEIMGMQHIEALAEHLNSDILGGVLTQRGTSFDRARTIFALLRNHKTIPASAVEAALVWCGEIEKVL